ncbi:MAG: DUF47 family protein [candidate division Zixibacteria bacterium]|nr:DUF47 family protein [candidate division Zixibacteria bacterium]
MRICFYKEFFYLLFKQSKILINEIDEYLDTVSEGALVFRQCIDEYLNGEKEKFETHRVALSNLEKKADSLRRGIENRLYTHSLMPENRGDVLGILESIDNVIDTAKKTSTQFSIELPEIPEELRREFITLTMHVTQGAESLVLATRAFFRDLGAVKDHLHKVYFYEKEADRAAENLNRSIFKMGCDLCYKYQLRHFVINVDKIADRSEAVADRIAIYTIKRTV